MKTSTKGTIAQIIICIMLLPFVGVIIKVYNLSIIEALIELIGEISIMEVWFDLLVKTTNLDELISLIDNFSDENMLKWATMMYQIWVIGFVIEIVGDISKKISLKGLPILPAVATVFFIAGFKRVTHISYISMVFDIFILGILYLLVKFFIVKASIIFTLFTGFFKLYINSCVALSATAYVAVLALIIRGTISGFLEIFSAVAMTMVALLISLFVENLLSGLKN